MHIDAGSAIVVGLAFFMGLWMMTLYRHSLVLNKQEYDLDIRKRDQQRMSDKLQERRDQWEQTRYEEKEQLSKYRAFFAQVEKLDETELRAAYRTIADTTDCADEAGKLLQAIVPFFVIAYRDEEK